ncbi:hypothetical protein BX600DRAFT_460865 [Xylariales sp. PMI_506]|nr:hypothetical protein BX600DRAFT_460865 [Xylariales sp. PMI_506]
MRHNFSTYQPLAPIHGSYVVLKGPKLIAIRAPQLSEDDKRRAPIARSRGDRGFRRLIHQSRQ